MIPSIRRIIRNFTILSFSRLTVYRTFQAISRKCRAESVFGFLGLPAATKLILGATLVLLVGCSQNSKSLNVPRPEVGSTGKGALVGAAVGGGLGLIVGSTSGNAGEGLLIGSVAGGAIGAGIGSQLGSNSPTTSDRAFQSKDKSSEEPYLREEDEFNQHRKEMKKDRDSSRDLSKRKPTSNDGIEWLSKPSRMRTPTNATQVARADSMRSEGRARLSDAERSSEAAASSFSRTESARRSKPAAGTGAISFADVKKDPAVAKKIEGTARQNAQNGGLPPAATTINSEDDTSKVLTSDPMPETRASLPVKSTAAGGSITGAIAPNDTAPKNTPQCVEARKEAERGRKASADADKLFYLRRAARLCPGEADYHAELGKILSAIGKTEDAKFELRQAIDLEPDHQLARDELSILENAADLIR